MHASTSGLERLPDTLPLHLFTVYSVHPPSVTSSPLFSFFFFTSFSRLNFLWWATPLKYSIHWCSCLSVTVFFFLSFFPIHQNHISHSKAAVSRKKKNLNKLKSQEVVSAPSFGNLNSAIQPTLVPPTVHASLPPSLHPLCTFLYGFPPA